MALRRSGLLDRLREAGSHTPQRTAVFTFLFRAFPFIMGSLVLVLDHRTCRIMTSKIRPDVTIGAPHCSLTMEEEARNRRGVVPRWTDA